MSEYVLNVFFFYLMTCCLVHVQTVTYPADCSPKESMPCLVHRYTNDACSPVALREKFPGVYETNTTKFPGKPGSLEAEARYRQYDPNTWYPEVNLTFTTPQNVGKNYVKGFEVVRYDLFSNPACYILDLSNVTWDESSLTEMETLFRLDLFPIRKDPGQQQVFAMFEVYALPKQANRDERYDQYLSVFIEFPANNNPNPTPENWEFTINYYQDSSRGTINVTVNTPPAEFGFSEFEYSLVNHSPEKIIEQKYITKTHWEFTKVPTGTYRIWVKPRGTGFKTTSTFPFNFTYTGLPLVTTPPPVETPAPTIIAPPPSSSSTPPTPTIKATTSTTTKSSEPASSSSSVTARDSVTTLFSGSTSGSLQESTTGGGTKADLDLKVAFSVVGSLLGMCLVGVVFVLYFRKCRNVQEKTLAKPPRDDPDLPALPVKNPAFKDDLSSFFSFGYHNNNEFANKMHFDKRPKVCLLYEEDNAHHRNVVMSFATYLQQHCQCDVMCVEWQLDTSWAHQDLQQANFIVIVNSEGAYKTYMKNQLHQSSPTNRRMSSINSIRNKFLQDDRYDNIVMVYFEYTSEKFILPDICPGYKYKLPKHFTDFLLHIHGLKRTDNLSEYDLPLDGNHIVRPIGLKFLESISIASKFQLENPNWSHKKYGFDRLCSHLSDDSKFDSGLPEDMDSPMQTPDYDKCRPPSFVVGHNQSDLHRLLDGQSVITVTPSALGLSVECAYDNAAMDAPHYFPPDATTTKSRPRLSPDSFSSYPEHVYNTLVPTPPACGTVESDFAFFPPDDLEDDFDVKSRSQSEQMQSIVEKYNARICQENEKTGLKRPDCIAEETSLRSVPRIETYDPNGDLYLLRVHSGEIPFIGSNMNAEVISLGGESV